MISVVMGAYNVGPYVREAIDSILNQTYPDFEFLIYNDGSTDDTADVIKTYTDPRIIFVDNKVNRSVSPNINEGIARARGKYIARMDADDTCHPERFAKQIAFMESHPEIGLCGSWSQFFGASSGIIQLPVENDIIQHTMWLQNAFYQPAVIMRANLLAEHGLRYDERYESAEDYKFWSEICWVTKVHNLPEVLHNYRIHAHQISRRKTEKQQVTVAKIRREQMARHGIELKPEQERAFEMLTNELLWGDYTLADYKQVIELLENLGGQARRLWPDKSGAVYIVLAEQWRKVLISAKHYYPAMIPYILRPSMSKYLNKVDLAKLVVKCLIRWKVQRAA